MSMALSMAFGVSVIACLFLLVTWGAVLFDSQRNHDRKYAVTAAGLMIANLGVGILVFNRTSAVMTGREIYPVVLLLAALVIVVGKTILMTGTSMGSRHYSLAAFALLSLVWLIFCLVWWL